MGKIGASPTDKTGLPRMRDREKAYGIGAQVRGLEVDPRPMRLKMPDRPSSIMEGKKITTGRTGALRRIVPDTQIEEIEVFAGRGTSKKLDVAKNLVENYGGIKTEWQHTKGQGFVFGDDGMPMREEIHWFEEPSVGIKEPNIKPRGKKR